jgi:tetratricopeptide (TPR) repeat protein
MTRVTAATTPQVASWLQEMQSMLEEHGGGELLVKFPRAMENATMLQPIFAVMPGLHFAATSESPVRDGVPAAATEPVDTEAIPPPRGDEGLPFNYQIDERALARGDLTPRDQMYELRREGQAAFQEGRYAEALDIWTKWHRLAPRDPAPLMLIGDVHMRMGNTELALERYRDSLDLDPGRISLAMRYARLLEREGRDEESIQLMNTYATLFPENPDILIAQSDWLARHNRYQEARNLINYALVLRPNDIDILVAALRLSDDSAERKDIIQRMVRVGDRPDMYLEFGEAIGRYQLLSMPDAHLLTPVIDRICNTTSNEQVHALFCRYQMLTEPVRESFNMNTLSESWKIYGGIVSFERQGQLQIQADPTHREASIQLEGSERTRDGHIEAGLLEWIGQFWLIARRGDGQFIRFGFDENNDLYLQSWVGGQNVSSQRRFWSGFTTPINLRLEIRGFSAMGFINGRRAFDVPLSIPHNLGLGSWGVAAHSPRFGTAKAELDHIRIGPLPANIAVAPPESPPDYLEKLKANIRHLSAISPEWFSVTAEGQIVENVRDENDILHILSRFHGIRLMPVMKISRLAGVPVEQLPALAAKYKVDGFVLEFPQLPDNDWFLELETMPGLSALQILALAIDQESMTASARGIGMGIGLLPANQSEVKTLVKYWDDFYDSLASEQTGIEHNILLYNPEEIP